MNIPYIHGFFFILSLAREVGSPANHHEHSSQLTTLDRLWASLPSTANKAVKTDPSKNTNMPQPWTATMKFKSCLTAKSVKFHSMQNFVDL